MGGRQDPLPFLDEVVIFNDTHENLKYVDVSCGKHEGLNVFDLAPGEKIAMRSSPVPGWTDSSGSMKYAIGYGGTSETGKNFSGVVDGSQRTASGGGSSRFQIVIKLEDLQ